MRRKRHVESLFRNGMMDVYIHRTAVIQGLINKVSTLSENNLDLDVKQIICLSMFRFSVDVHQ